MLIEDPDKNARVEERLRTEPVIWLTTVSHDGQPQSTPVWFLWDGDRSLVIYSQPGRPKLANIAANPKVSLHFNDHAGDDIVQLEGEAVVDHGEPSLLEVPDYLEKYRELIPHIEMEPEPFAASYSVPIRVTITRVRHPF